MCIGLAIEKIAWDVAGVDRLNDDVAAGFCSLGGGKGEVLFIGVVQNSLRCAFGSDTRHDVNARTIEGGGIVERRADRIAKFALSTGESRKTALVSVPVSRWCVEHCLCNTGCFPPLGDVIGRPFIREEEFDTFETVACRGGEPIRERDLGIHHR